jgi:hypothetical protein
MAVLRRRCLRRQVAGKALFHWLEDVFQPLQGNDCHGISFFRDADDEGPPPGWPPRAWSRRKTVFNLQQDWSPPDPAVLRCRDAAGRAARGSQGKYE